MSQQNQKLGPPWTTLKILNWTIGYFERNDIPNPRFDAEMLLSHALGFERIMLYAHFDRPLDKDELSKVRAMIKRRAEHEPVAYITGSRGFWTIELKTDPRALIPRPDTETLVERALEILPEDSDARVVDIGTGSGAIALAIAEERPGARLAATDISAEALALASENAKHLDLTERVDFFEGDLFDALPDEWAQQPLDMIVSNPPYIAAGEVDEMGEDVKKHEPDGALFAGEDGLEIIRRLVPAAFARLKDEGHLLCEIGHRQRGRVVALFEEAGFIHVDVFKDLGQKDPVVVGTKPA